MVAAEVHSLARHSANAASEIKVLILDSVERIEAGSALIHKAGASMQDIDQSVQRVSTRMQEICATAQVQREGMQQVHRSVTDLDQFFQQNAALVKHASAAAESLSAQAASHDPRRHVPLLSASSVGVARQRRRPRPHQAGPTRWRADLTLAKG